ncbi:MAG: hypothetical protein ACFB15_09850 [Cyclobacteriaceae bacterium]
MEILPRTVLRVLASPKNITAEDQETLEKAIAEYPYFQLARTLVAKAKHDQQASDAYDSLGDAAIYAPDRRHLRKVFYEDVRIDWQESVSDTIAEAAEDASATVEPLVAEESNPENTVIETLEESPETISNLSDMATSDVEASNVETSIAEETKEPDLISEEVTTSTDQTTIESEETTAASEETTTEVEEAPVESETTEDFSSGVANHDEEEEMVYRELEENLRRLRKAKEESQAEEEDKKKIAEPTEVPSNAVQSNVSAHSPLLLDYLHGVEPVSSERLGIHQQKQNELINKFVNSDTSPVDRFRPVLLQDDVESEDLSEGSSTYNDELVTENLAEIMLRQGKRGKAIEIYQQLMLKNPEKKAYFAEKIDHLKEG